jgi:sec-independent protein translocase protein TatA
MATGLLTPTHVAIALIVLLLIVGPKRLPQAGRALGTGVREFKDALTGRDVASIASADTGVVTTSDTNSTSTRGGQHDRHQATHRFA